MDARCIRPIDGIAGVANSQVGDLVGTTTKMTTVSQVNPIWAYFNITESAYLANAEAINQAIRGGRQAARCRVNDRIHPGKWHTPTRRKAKSSS